MRTTAPSTASTDALAQVEPMAPHPYVGMWVTADSYIHQELANGRYNEARGPLHRLHRALRGPRDRIECVDDTGFTAEGRFAGDVLFHGGYVFYGRGSPAHRAVSG